MNTLNFNSEPNLQASIVITECHDEGYDAYFSGESCPYENYQDEKISWDAGFKHAKMDDLGV